MRLFYLLFSSAHVLMARRAQRLKSPAGASSCLRGLPGRAPNWSVSNFPRASSAHLKIATASSLSIK